LSTDRSGDVAAQPSLANPASQNCVKKGGKLVIEKIRKGGEYGAVGISA